MWKVFWWGAGVVAVILAFAVVTAVRSTFLFHHPRAKDVRIVIDKSTGVPVVAALADPKSAVAANLKPLPLARVDSKTHDFGTMDPMSVGTHQFVVRNAGTAPLELTNGPTTCKCTVGGLSNRHVEPGEFATVNLEWNTGRKQLQFAQSAVVYTNDPLNKALEFTVEGRVRTLVATDVEQIQLPPQNPDTTATTEFFVYSQLWSDIEVVDLEGQLPKLTWRVDDGPADAASRLGALALKRVHLEFSHPVSDGQFVQTLRLKVCQAGSDNPPENLDLPIAGSIIRRLAVYGPDIGPDGIVDLGKIDQGKSRRSKLLVKIRDKEPVLDRAKVEVFPEFLTATLQPHAGQTPGMYDLIVEVPAGVPACQYLTSPLGRVRIQTGHPRIGEVELGVSFAVLPRS